jgi:hypothetical protein
MVPSTRANVPAIVVASGLAIAARVSDVAGEVAKRRKGFIIQNVGTGAIFIRLGAVASATVFHIVLKGGTGDSDGNGGSFSMLADSVYQGDVYVFGTTPKFVVTEIS